MEVKNLDLVENNFIKSSKQTYELLDIMKFICAIFVVGIHSKIMSNEANSIQWYVMHVFFRIAVPFFFISSGFLFGKKYFENQYNLKEICLKQIKRLIIPFVFWMIISLPYKIVTTGGENCLTIIIEIIKSAIFYPWGALWFVLAVIVAIGMEYIFLKKRKLKYAIILGIFLSIIALLGNSYYFLLEGTPLKGIMDAYIKIFISTRNGILVGFPIFTVGVYMAKKENIISKICTSKLFTCLLFALFTLICEVTFIRNKNYIDDHSLFFSTIFVVLILLALCIRYRNLKVINIKTKLLRNLSTGIYFMHAPIIRYGWLLKLNIGNWGMFFGTIIISIFLCLILYKVNNKYITYLIK